MGFRLLIKIFLYFSTPSKHFGLSGNYRLARGKMIKINVTNVVPGNRGHSQLPFTGIIYTRYTNRMQEKEASG